MKLPVVSTREVIRVLQKVGFSYAPKRGKGSHLAETSAKDPFCHPEFISGSRLLKEGDAETSSA